MKSIYHQENGLKPERLDGNRHNLRNRNCGGHWTVGLMSSIMMSSQMITSHMMSSQMMSSHMMSSHVISSHMMSTHVISSQHCLFIPSSKIKTFSLSLPLRQETFLSSRTSFSNLRQWHGAVCTARRTATRGSRTGDEVMLYQMTFSRMMSSPRVASR